MGLGLIVGAAANRRQMRGSVVAVLCVVGAGIVLFGALLALSVGLL